VLLRLRAVTVAALERGLNRKIGKIRKGRGSERAQITAVLSPHTPIF
jgi:hypothetical protein